VDVLDEDSAMSGRSVEQLDYTVPRLTVPVPDALEFTRRYEAAVPDLPIDAVRELLARRASWSEMERLIGDAAPFGEGQAWFTIDQPSAQFQSFGIPKVSEVGIELDHKVATLLEALSVPIPDVLR
jgi:hypothetical protein